MRKISNNDIRVHRHRFTQEIFAALISLLYLYESFGKLINVSGTFFCADVPPEIPRSNHCAVFSLSFSF